MNVMMENIKMAVDEYRQNDFQGAVSLCARKGRSAAGKIRKNLCGLLRHRTFQAYCVGVPRTGTTSVAGMFRVWYRSRHEAGSENSLKWSFDYIEGKIDRTEYERFIVRRDNDLFLEMDSSTHNFYMIPSLVRLFPQAKFLVSMRDPVSWLNSYIDYGINNRIRAGTNAVAPQKTRMARFRYGDLYRNYSRGEQTLKDYDMPSLEAFLFFYRQYYEAVLESIPEDRRVLFNTFEIERQAPAICAFLGISPSSLSMINSRLNRGVKKHHVLAKTDPRYLQERVDYYCGDLMKRFYPDVTVESVLGTGTL